MSVIDYSNTIDIYGIKYAISGFQELKNINKPVELYPVHCKISNPEKKENIQPEKKV